MALVEKLKRQTRERTEATYPSKKEEAVKRIEFIKERGRVAYERATTIPPRRTPRTYTPTSYSEKLGKSIFDTSKTISETETVIKDINPDAKYWLTIPGHHGGTPTKMRGSILVERYYDPYLSELKEHKSSITVFKSQVSKYHPETRIRESAKGVEIIPRSGLGWSKKQLESIEEQNLPPVIKELTLTGFYGGQAAMSLGQPIKQFFDVISGKEHPPDYVPRHHVSWFDIVGEPFGWSPKGSTELLGRHPVHSAVGGGLVELPLAWGFGKALKPVGSLAGRVGGKVVRYAPIKSVSSHISSAVDDIMRIGPKATQPYYHAIKQFVFQSPKRYGLKGGMVAPAKLTGTPAVLGRTFEAVERFGQRFGILRGSRFGAVGVYKAPRFFGKSVWSTPVRGGSKTGLEFIYKPGQMFLGGGKVGMTKPVGWLSRDVKLYKGLWSLGYSSDDIIKSVTRLNKPIASGKFIGRTASYSAADILKPVPSGGFHTLRGGGGLLSYIPPGVDFTYQPVSRLMPTSMLGAFPKSIFVPKMGLGLGLGIKTGGLGAAASVSGRSFSGLTQVMKNVNRTLDFHFNSLSNIPLSIRGVSPAKGVGLGFRSGQVSLKQLDRILSPKPALAQMQGVDSYFDKFYHSTSKVVRQPDYSKVSYRITPPFWLPSSGLYGRGKLFYDWDIWGKKYRYRQFHVPSIAEVLKRFKI